VDSLQPENPETQPAETKPETSSLMKFLVDTLETLVLAVVVFVIINAVSARIRVDGPSMQPNLMSGQYVIVNKLAYRLGKPARGDVIMFYFPRNPLEEYIKRVVGLPGDKVTIENGVVYINGEVLDEPYLDQSPLYNGSWMVPEGHLFVLGDNRNDSSDSHNWGTVPLSYVIGKAVLVYWPPTDWGAVGHAAAANHAP